MYKYFLGKRSNLATKQEKDPIVIGASDEAREQINQWLDKYEVDLDSLIQPITFVLELQVIDIEENEEKELSLALEGNNHAVLILKNEEEPKFEINASEIEYTIVIGDEFYVESFMEFVGDAKMGVDFTQEAVFMGKGNVYIMVKFEQFDFSIYEAMKKNIDKLSVWDNIAKNMIWYKELPVDIPAYELTITFVDEKGFFITRINVIHDRIFTYLQSNSSGEYQVESDGNWIAEHDVFNYRYNAWEKKLSVEIPKGIIIPVRYYFTCLSYVFDYTRTMFQTICVINATFDKINKYKK